MFTLGVVKVSELEWQCSLHVGFCLLRGSVAKCRGSWVVGKGRGSWVWVVGMGRGCG